MKHKGKLPTSQNKKGLHFLGQSRSHSMEGKPWALMRPFYSLLFHTGRKPMKPEIFPKRASPVVLPHLSSIQCTHRKITGRASCHHSGFKANEGLFLAHTLHTMVVFPDHVCKAKTKAAWGPGHSASQYPKWIEQRGSREGKKAEERAETLMSSKYHRCFNCLTLPTGSPHTRSYLSSIQWKHKQKARKAGPQLHCHLGIEGVFPASYPSLRNIIKGWKGSLNSTHHGVPSSCPKLTKPVNPILSTCMSVPQ